MKNFIEMRFVIGALSMMEILSANSLSERILAKGNLLKWRLIIGDYSFSLKL